MILTTKFQLHRPQPPSSCGPGNVNRPTLTHFGESGRVTTCSTFEIAKQFIVRRRLQTLETLFLLRKTIFPVVLGRLGVSSPLCRAQTASAEQQRFVYHQDDNCVVPLSFCILWNFPTHQPPVFQSPGLIRMIRPRPRSCPLAQRQPAPNG